MTYCRFSSDDWRSDIFAFEGEDGWVVEVAGRRLLTLPPAIDRGLDASTAEGRAIWQQQHREQMSHLATAERIAIDHPDAGSSHVCASAGAAADLLERLAAEGFHVPTYAIEQLRAEEAENSEDRP